MASLVVRSRDGSTRTVPLTDAPISIGRAETCDIVLRNDAEVSREHARVWLDEDGHVFVADSNSKNGTRVDQGEPFHNATRAAYRTIRVGEHDIEVLGAPDPAQRPADRVRFAPDAPSAMGTTRFFPSSRKLDLNSQRLALLMSLTERIGSTFDRKQLLEQALDACCEALGFERGLIALKTTRGETELPVTRNVQRDETGAYKVSRTLIRGALEEGKLAVVNDPAVDLVNNLTESLVRFPIRSALCVPILNRDRILGVIYGDRIQQAPKYTPADVDFLAAIARQVGVGLANLDLFRDYVELQKLSAQLEQARGIQQGLLPARPLTAGRIVVEGYNEPSSAVGGDYFDYFELGDGRLGLIIADVTGHGLPAALLMANLQAAVRVALTAHIPLPALAERINELTCQNTASDVFITAILGTIDTRTGALEYVSAGHPAPVILGPSWARVPDDENSLPLGIDPDEKYAVRQIAPSEGAQALLFYTDGLIEAANPQGEILQITPVIHALRAAQHRAPGALLGTALELVRGHLAGEKPTDDLTLMAISLTS